MNQRMNSALTRTYNGQQAYVKHVDRNSTHGKFCEGLSCRPRSTRGLAIRLVAASSYRTWFKLLHQKPLMKSMGMIPQSFILELSETEKLGINHGSLGTPDEKRSALNLTWPEQGQPVERPHGISMMGIVVEDPDLRDQASPNLAIISSAQAFAASSLAVKNAQ